MKDLYDLDPWWSRLKDWRGFHRVACLFGRHHYKLGSYSRTGRRGGCIYCGKDRPHAN